MASPIVNLSAWLESQLTFAPFRYLRDRFFQHSWHPTINRSMGTEDHQNLLHLFENDSLPMLNAHRGVPTDAVHVDLQRTKPNLKTTAVFRGLHRCLEVSEGNGQSLLVVHDKVLLFIELDHIHAFGALLAQVDDWKSLKQLHYIVFEITEGKQSYWVEM